MRSTLSQGSHLRAAPPRRRAPGRARRRLPRSLGVCRVYRQIREDWEREQEAKGRPDLNYEMPDIEQFSMGGDWEITPKEWHVIKRVADQLFPEGCINWEDFWFRDDYEEWYGKWRYLLEKEDLPQYEDSLEGQRMWLIKAMKYLETRWDYAQLMPHDFAEGPDVPDPPTPAKEFDPDWDDWDFRAMMEKRRAREKGRREWRRYQREELGKYEYINTVAIDSRIPDEEREGYNWSEEEVWDLITQNGRAFDPRKDKGPWLEMSPDEFPDWAGEGNEYVEEIDEYMMRKGLMVEDEKYFERENARLAGRAVLDYEIDKARDDVFDDADPFDPFDLVDEDEM